jgi:hypothetical protein
MDLPITRAVQQVAAKTRITTRRNILTPDLLSSVWPRCWVQLIYSGGIFTNLHVTRRLTIRYQSCGGESYDMRTSWVLLLCRSHVLSPYLMTWSIGPSTCTGCATWVFTVRILTKVKVSLISLEDSERGWNVGLPSLIWHSAQLGQQSCQLHALSSLYPQGNSLALFSVRGWNDRRGNGHGQKK